LDLDPVMFQAQAYLSLPMFLLSWHEIAQACSLSVGGDIQKGLSGIWAHGVMLLRAPWVCVEMVRKQSAAVVAV